MDKTLDFLLSAAYCTLGAALNENFKKANLQVSMEQWRLLNVLKCKVCSKQQDVATLLLKEKHTITRLVDTLEQQDLVQRITNTADRRQNSLEITAQGIEIWKEAMPIIQQTLSDSLRGFSNDEESKLSDLLQRILYNLKGEEVKDALIYMKEL